MIVIQDFFPRMQTRALNLNMSILVDKVTPTNLHRIHDHFPTEWCVNKSFRYHIIWTGWMSYLNQYQYLADKGTILTLAGIFYSY